MANNPIQKTTGPCIILAGAGTGKTYTSIEKIKYLVQNNHYKPSEILCLTFSNEATNELKNRLSQSLPQSSEVTIKTFHAFCADVLREFGSLVKVDPEFQILLPDDAKVLFHKYLDISPYWANRYVSTISTARDFGITLEQIKEHVKKLAQDFKGIKDLDNYAEELDLELKTMHLNPADNKEAKAKRKERKDEISEFLQVYHQYIKFTEFIEAWEGYLKLKKEKHFLDYSDLTDKALEYFRKFGSEKYVKRFKYLFVDEFQDTNKQQFELIEHLGSKHKNITIVGDPNQTIYGFRGAYRESFNHFKEVFEVTSKDQFALDKSRRSPNTILRIAHKLIENNYEVKKDCIFVENYEGREGDKVECYQLLSSQEEARKIAELVEEAIEKKIPLSEICVIFRTHKQGEIIEQALEAKGIPIISAGESNLTSQPEIKTVIAYLSILNNLRERTGTGEQGWWSLFHYHNALSPEDSIKIGRYLKEKKDDGISIDEALLHNIEHLKLSDSGKEIVRRVVSKIKELLPKTNLPLPKLILDLYELIGLNRAFSHERTPHNIESMMNLRQFYDLAVNYYQLHGKELNSFIKYLEILNEVGVDIPASRVKEINAVRLMTVHATKGLQFDTVIVSNLAENRFPITRTHNEPLIPKELLPEQKKILDNLKEGEDPEEAIKEYEKMTLLIEERRLAYVAFTRAKRRLVLTFARSYNSETDSATPSTFLVEVEFKENKDLKLIEDNKEESLLFAPCSKYEILKSSLKHQFISALDSEDFEDLFSRLVHYHSLREGKVLDLKKLNLKVDAKPIEERIKMFNEKVSCLHFDPANFTFSPTALLEYDDCPKKYELSKILQMPQAGDFDESSDATDKGTLVHEILEEGVKAGFNTLKQFLYLAKEKLKSNEWYGIDYSEVEPLLKVFWARNEGQYDEKSIVEDWFNVTIDGLRFNGKVDRIDVDSEGATIIDYKTGKKPDVRHRSWQLGFYALAAQSRSLKVKSLVLEMLNEEKPIVMTLVGDEVKGPDGRTKGFLLSEVRKEMVECAKRIVHDYEHEFKVSIDDKPCRFCGYKFYCSKWG